VQTLAVFCGSSNGASDIYIEGARNFGKELVKRNIALVYGGASVGMMGAIANAVLQSGGRVIGIMPDFLEKREKSHDHLTELIIVNSMHERKAKMAELADGFIALPGGPGTMEEFFEIFTWSQLGLHQKPLGFLNTNHYYDSLLAMFGHMFKEGFMHEKFLNMAMHDSDPQSLLDKLAAYKPLNVKSYLTNNRL